MSSLRASLFTLRRVGAEVGMTIQVGRNNSYGSGGNVWGGSLSLLLISMMRGNREEWAWCQIWRRSSIGRSGNFSNVWGILRGKEGDSDIKEREDGFGASNRTDM